MTPCACRAAGRVNAGARSIMFEGFKKWWGKKKEPQREPPEWTPDQLADAEGDYRAALEGFNWWRDAQREATDAELERSEAHVPPEDRHMGGDWRDLESPEDRNADDYNPAWEGGPSNPTPQERLDHATEGLDWQKQRVDREIDEGRQAFREGRGETEDQMWDRHNDERWDMDTAAHSFAGQEMPSQQDHRHRVERKDREWLEQTQDEPPRQREAEPTE